MTSENREDPWPQRRARKLFRISRRVGEVVFTGLVVAVTVVTSWAAYLNVATGGWNADAAAWVQAAGSIIAIAGAAWLARSEAREARRWRREQGEEAAWAVRFVIAQAQLDTQIVAAELTRQDVGFDALDIRSWKQRAINASLALQTMLTRADYIHAVVILTASNAKVLVDHLLDDLQRLEGIVMREEQGLDGNLLASIVSAHTNLAALLEQYDARVRGIRLAMDRGDDMLPLEELAAWSDKRK